MKLVMVECLVIEVSILMPPNMLASCTTEFLPLMSSLKCLLEHLMTLKGLLQWSLYCIMADKT